MRTNSRLLSSSGGFSLIELLTVLLLVGLLASLAAPSMGAFIQVNRTREALNTLAGDVGFARVLAIREGERVTLRIESPTAYSLTLGSGTAPLKRVDLAAEYPSVLLQAEGLPGGELVFDSRGMALSMGSAGGKVVAQGQSARDSLMISAVGRVYRAR